MFFCLVIKDVLQFIEGVTSFQNEAIFKKCIHYFKICNLIYEFKLFLLPNSTLERPPRNPAGDRSTLTCTRCQFPHIRPCHVASADQRGFTLVCGEFTSAIVKSSLHVLYPQVAA